MGKFISLAWASFGGRGDRKEFWIGLLMMIVAGAAMVWASVQLEISLIWTFLLILPLWLFYASRRFHDLGLPGALSGLPLATRFGLAIILGLSGVDPVMGATIVGAASWTVVLGSLLWLGCARGQPDANEFGPPPGQEDAADIF